MNYRTILRTLASVLIIEAALLSLPMLVGLIYKESAMPYLITALLILAVSLPVRLFLKSNGEKTYARDGFVIVGFTWILMSLFGALPFVISGAIPNYVDAVFEIVSGFTTTGATILKEIASLPKGILFWRSLSHWIGGMGVLVFMLAIIPQEGASIHIMRAEVPGPQKGKIVPKLRDSSIILYAIYLALTVIMAIALLFTGLPLYDSVITAISTAGTGGFSVLNNSIMGYANPAAEWVIAIFMLLFGVNFNIYFFIIIKKWRGIVKNEELRAYFIMIIASVTIITVNLFTKMAEAFDGIGHCIRAAFFQVMAISSTTGYSSMDFDLWPNLSKTVLLLLMFIGGCAGSTAGGLKVSRIMITLKTLRLRIKKMIKPNAVTTLRLDGEPIDQSTGNTAINYLSLYSVLLVITVLLISIDGHDLITNITAAITCINNVGPGFGNIIGPAYSFADFSVFSKIVLSFTMLFGRLELIPMIIILAPSTYKHWKSNKTAKSHN